MQRSNQARGPHRVACQVARRLVVLTSLALVLGGCGEEPSTEVARSSGALAEGFEIESGSGLIGAVFPVALPYGGGHKAILRVDENAERVFDGYVRQAKDLGYSFDPAQGGGEQWCGMSGEDVAADDSSSRFQSKCLAYGSKPDGWQVSLAGFVGPDGKGVIDLVTGLYSNAPAPSTFESSGAVAPPTNDELAPDLAPSRDEPIRVVTGSELIMDPLPSSCSTGGYVAVLRVTDELMPVMRGYLEQFAASGFTSDGFIGNEDAPRVSAQEAGGGALTALGLAGDPSHVLIERCND